MTITTSTPLTSPAVDFAQLAAVLMLAGDGGHLEARALYEGLRAKSPRIERILSKSAVGAATTGGETWASPMVGDLGALSGGFMEKLRSIGAFDRILAGGARVFPPRSRIVAQTQALVPPQVDEGLPKAVTKLSFATQGTGLQLEKAAAMVVLSEEVLQGILEGGAGFLQRELLRGAAASSDAIFLDLVTDGVTPITSGGDDGPSIAEDVQSLSDALDLTAESVPYLMVPPLLAKRLGTIADSEGRHLYPVSLKGGTLGIFEVLVTDALATDEVVAVDAAQLAVASGPARLAAARHASLQMDDDPGTQDATTGTGTSLVSLWQTNCRAIRVERDMAAMVIGGGNAVVTMDSVGWGAPASA